MNVLKDINNLLDSEKERQNNEINLIASENYASQDVLNACGHCIQNKYSEGYVPDSDGNYRRYYGGCRFVDKIEQLTMDLVCKAFGTKYSNVQSHCGSSANLAVYLSACQYFKCKPNELTIISHSLNSGSHLTHGSKASISGKWFNAKQFELDSNNLFNFTKMKEMLDEVNGPTVLVVGFSAYPREIKFDVIADIVNKSNKDIVVLCDTSHISGLIVTGEHQNPFNYDWGKAHLVLTSTTHKTLRGARHAIITTNDETMSKLIEKAVFPGINGGPLQNMIAAVGVAMNEALQPEFKDYIKRLKENIKAMEGVFNSNNIDMVSGGSDNHLILLDLSKYSISGRELESRLESIGIVTNKNAIPNDKAPKTETSGLRIGTAAITTRGFDTEDCKVIASIIARAVVEKDWEPKEEEVLFVKTLCERKPIYRG